MKRLALVIAIVALALAILACGGGGDPPKPDPFTRDCKARGGHVQKTQRGKVCAPPVGGWG